MENNTPISNSKNRLNFQLLRKNGHRVVLTSWLIVYWDYNDLHKTRIVWNLSRKVSNAVVRNKLKRWCRENIRNSEKLSTLGLDLNFVFKPQAKDFYKDLRREELDKELLKLEKKISDNFKFLNKNS